MAVTPSVQESVEIKLCNQSRSSVWSSSSSTGGFLSDQCGSVSPSPHHSPWLLTLVACLVTCPGPPFWQFVVSIETSLKPQWDSRSQSKLKFPINLKSGCEHGPGENSEKNLHFQLLVCFICICMTKEASTELLGVT